MQVFGVAGPGADRLIGDLADRLDGRVAVVRAAGPDGDATQRVSAATTVERTGEGWRAAWTDWSLDDVLDELAPAHDYAILPDPPSAVPAVALGDADPAETLHAAETAEAVDREAVLAAVDELEPRETLASLVERVKRSPAADRAGAIATFTGRVRARDDPRDVPTEYLEFETYEAVATDRMASIAEDLESRQGVREVAMHHRTGVVEAGEDIVFVVVLAGHREEAFDAARDGIDRLKDEVPIFKREVTAEETFWVHER